MRIFFSIFVSFWAAVSTISVAQDRSAPIIQSPGLSDRAEKLVDKIPRLELKASAYLKDFENWIDEIVLNDQSLPIHLRWTYHGPQIDHGVALLVRDKNGILLQRKDYSAAAPGAYRRIDLPLAPLPARDEYRFTVQVLDEDGNFAFAPSNVVTLKIQASEYIPFMFGDISADGIREDWNVPGLVGGTSCLGGFQQIMVGGVRKHGTSVLVQPTDRWHIGSNSKQFLTTLLAKVIEENPNLTWQTRLQDLTLGEDSIFPELKPAPFEPLIPSPIITPDSNLHPTLYEVTLEQLVSFRSGIDLPSIANSPTRQITNYSRNPVDFRAETVIKILQRPRARPRGSYKYGQGEYMIATVIIERLLNKPYEQLVQERIFNAIGMPTADFGMPTDLALNYQDAWVDAPSVALSVNTTAQPNGHQFPNQKITVDNLAVPPVWNGPGGIYLSMADWLKFLRLHADGQSGNLSLSQIQRDKLHTPYNNADKQGNRGSDYGLGWAAGNDNDLGPKIEHNGSYGRFYSRAIIYLDRGIIIAAVSNMQPGENEEVEDDPTIPYPFYGDDAVDDMLSYMKQEAMLACPAATPFSGKLPTLQLKSLGTDQRSATSRNLRAPTQRAISPDVQPQAQRVVPLIAPQSVDEDKARTYDDGLQAPTE